MTSNATPQERQEEEVTVLRSIFSTEILDLTTTNVWNLWSGLDITIHVEPRTDKSRVNVFADLRFNCGKKYPNEPPKISIKDSRGITESQLKVLLDVLNSAAVAHSHDSMIYDLWQECTKFLEELEEQQVGSLQDVRLKKQALHEVEKRRQRHDSEQRELEEIAKEDERRRLELLKKKEAEEVRKQQQLKDLGIVGDFITVTIAGKPVQIYKKPDSVRRRMDPSVMGPYCEEWIAVDGRREFYVSEWTFTHSLSRKFLRKNEIDFRKFLGHLDNFQTTMMEKFRTSIDLFLYPIAFVHVNRTSIDASDFCVSLMIGQNIPKDDKCFLRCLRDTTSHPEEKIPTLACTIVCALRKLHEHKYRHGSIHNHCIWVTTLPGGAKEFRLSDVGYLLDVHDLCEEFSSLIAVTRNRDSPPLSPLHKSQRIKEMENEKRDMADLGLLLEALISNRESPIGNCSEDFLKELSNFTRACQTSKSIEQLVNHSFLNLCPFPKPPTLTTGSSFVESDDDVNYGEHNRLNSEFINIRYLGDGGFGQVLLCRNKLDGNDYAIKMIGITSDAVNVVRSVNREVNVLSKLTHPHIVRYFAAWMERPSTISEHTNSTQDSFTDNSNNSVVFEDNSESCAPTSESSSFGFVADHSRLNTLSSDVHGRCSLDKSRMRTITTLFNQGDPSKTTSEFDVVYDDAQNIVDHDHLAAVQEEDEDETEGNSGFRVLYIQMEFCEGNTLRKLIDDGTMLNDTRLTWRLFRETLSGLEYIHSQHMIHRDIKPGNIFLDGSMSVKIGDFGLATLHTIGKVENFNADTTVISHGALSPSNQTKDIGTGFYIAPEVSGETLYSKQTYDNRCDVFSMGVVLFEMFYKPLPLGMERVDVMKELRNRIEFPDDFAKELSVREAKDVKKLISMMVQLDPRERPLISELLESELVPFYGSEVADFQTKFGVAIRNRKSVFHYWVKNELLSLEMPSTSDYLFDNGVYRERYKHEPKKQTLIANITQDLRSLFCLHGLTELPTNLLHPFRPTKNPVLNNARQPPVKILDAHGNLLGLSTDLRIGFVRYAARNGIKQIRRFEFGRVLSHNDQVCYPAERVECVVDMVGTIESAPYLAAEVLALVLDLERHVSVLNGSNLILRIGHCKLIKSVCLNHSLDFKTVLEFFNSMVYNKRIKMDEKVKRLNDLIKLGPSTCLTIMKTLEPGSLSELVGRLPRNKSSNAYQLAKEALDELQTILNHLTPWIQERAVNVILDPSLVYRPSVFCDGIVFLMQVKDARESRRSILAGGRYDSFLLSQRNVTDLAVSSSPLCAFGLNIALEGLYNIAKDKKPIHCRALVHAFSKEFNNEACEILREIRAQHHSAMMYHGKANQESLEYCKANGIPFLATLTLDNATKGCRVVLYEDTSLTLSGRKGNCGDYCISRLSVDEAIAFIVNTDFNDANNSVTQSTSEVFSSSNSRFSTSSTATTPCATTSRTSTGTASTSATYANVNVNFAMPEKPAHNARKKIEAQVRTQLQEMLCNINAKRKVEVFATELPLDVLNECANTVNRRMNAEEFRTASEHLGNPRQKAAIAPVVQAMTPFFSSSDINHSPLVLWTRLAETQYRIIM